MNHGMFFIREYERCNLTNIKPLLQNENILDLVVKENIQKYKIGDKTIHFDLRNSELYAKQDCDTNWHFISKYPKSDLSKV